MTKRTFEEVQNFVVETLGTDSAISAEIMRQWSAYEDRRCYGDMRKGFPWSQAYSHLGGDDGFWQHDDAYRASMGLPSRNRAA